MGKKSKNSSKKFPVFLKGKLVGEAGTKTEALQIVMANVPEHQRVFVDGVCLDFEAGIKWVVLASDRAFYE